MVNRCVSTNVFKSVPRIYSTSYCDYIAFTFIQNTLFVLVFVYIYEPVFRKCSLIKTFTLSNQGYQGHQGHQGHLAAPPPSGTKVWSFARMSVVFPQSLSSEFHRHLTDRFYQEWRHSLGIIEPLIQIGF